MLLAALVEIGGVIVIRRIIKGTTIMLGCIVSGFANALDLASVCPSPLVVQTAWTPVLADAALYNLLGERYVFDLERNVTRGPLEWDGVNLGIELEVRVGGPAIGYQSPWTMMVLDDSIHLGAINLDRQLRDHDRFPLVAVVALQEKSTHMLMWDANVLAGVEGFRDLGARNVPIRVYGTGDSSIAFFLAQGMWSSSNIDPSADGTLFSLLSEAAAGRPLAQVGDVTEDVFRYRQESGETRSASFALFHDEGYVSYTNMLAVRADQVDTLRECLALAVPMIQRSMVAYLASPQRANAVLVQASQAFGNDSFLDDATATFGALAMKQLGIIGNGQDGIAGSFDLERVQGVIDALKALDDLALIPEAITAAMVVTNEFIDPRVSHKD